MKILPWLLALFIAFSCTNRNQQNDELLNQLGFVNEQLDESIERHIMDFRRAYMENPVKASPINDLAESVHNYSEKLLAQIDDEENKHDELRFLHKIYVDSLNSWRRRFYGQDSLVNHIVELKEDTLFRSAMKNRVLMNEQIFMKELAQLVNVSSDKVVLPYVKTTVQRFNDSTININFASEFYKRVDNPGLILKLSDEQKAHLKKREDRDDFKFYEVNLTSMEPEKIFPLNGTIGGELYGIYTSTSFHLDLDSLDTPTLHIN